MTYPTPEIIQMTRDLMAQYKQFTPNWLNDVPAMWKYINDGLRIYFPEAFED